MPSVLTSVVGHVRDKNRGDALDDMDARKATVTTFDCSVMGNIRDTNRGNVNELNPRRDSQITVATSVIGHIRDTNE